MSDSKSKAYPAAPEPLQAKLYALAQAAAKVGQLRRGANEATKALNKGRAELVLLAADADPLEIVLHLPLLSEEKNVPYVFVASKAALGRACGVERAAIAVALTAAEHSPLQRELDAARLAVEQLPI